MVRFGSIGRSGKPLLYVLAFSLLFIGYVPTNARDPLDRERTMAGIRMYFAPKHNLAVIDAALIEAAKHRIDMAAYVLTDDVIMKSLIVAAGRGVKIRLYLDPNQPAARDAQSLFWRLVGTDGINVKMKYRRRNLMHLKAYHVDGRLVRTGAANFSYSGARRQDNDLVIIESKKVAKQFIVRFNLLWTRPGTLPFKKK